MFKYMPPMILAAVGLAIAGPFGAFIGILVWVAMELIVEPNKPKKTKK